MVFNYPKLDFFPCTVKIDYLPLQINNETTTKKSVIISIGFQKAVDVTYPWPNHDNKSYTKDEMRRIIGTFLEMDHMFSFEDDHIYVDKDEHGTMEIRIGHPTEDFVNGKSDYYWYHTAMSMVEKLTDTRTGIIGIVTGEVDGKRKVTGFRFQPCNVEDLEEASKYHLDDLK